jgi:excisionase family DNA binding protein
MENVQMLVPMEPNAFWQKLKTIVEQVVAESKQTAPVDKHSERPLLKAKEVCEIFHISKPTIYEWLKQGKIKSVKIQSRRYFHWTDVEELIQKSKVNASTVRP